MRGFCSFKSIYFSPKIIISYWTKGKTLIIFFLVFDQNDILMIAKLIDSVSNFAISGDGIIIITLISRYFQVWNDIDEKFVKNVCYRLISCNYFFGNCFLLTFLGDNFFSMSVILDFVFILSVKNCFSVFLKVLLSVMSLILILLKKFFFHS